MKKLLLLTLAVVLVMAVAIILVGCKTTTQTATVTQTATKTLTSTIQQTTTTTTTATPIPTVTPKYGGTLRMGDPFFFSTNLGWTGEPGWGGDLCACLFMDELITVDANGVSKPNLATAWEVAPDLTSITFTLRQGVKFQDGSDWNATVAKWNLDNYIAAKSANFVNISSVDILGDYQIRLNITKYTNTIFDTLGGTYVVSKAAFDAHGGGEDAMNWMKLNPVGTGPFKLESFTPMVSLKAVRWDGYWKKGLPYLDAVEFYGIADTMTRVASFRAGEVDVIGGDLSQAEYGLQQEGFPVIQGYLALSVLTPDSANPDSPFSNLKVRQAIDYAIDRDAIAKSLGYGFWPATFQYALPGTSCYITDLSPRPYSVDKAKQLLEEAGYGAGFHTQILGNTIISNKDVLTAIQGYLSKVNITADVVMLDMGAYNDAMAKGWDGLAGASRSIDANPNFAFESMYSKESATTQHVSWQRTDELQALEDAASASPEYNPELTKKVIRYIYDNAMLTCLYGVARGQVMYPYVHDLGFYTNTRALDWTPGLAWMSK